MRRALPADELSALDWAVPEGFRRTDGRLVVPLGLRGPTCALAFAPRIRKRKSSGPPPPTHATISFVSATTSGNFTSTPSTDFFLAFAFRDSSSTLPGNMSGWDNVLTDNSTNPSVRVCSRQGGSSFSFPSSSNAEIIIVLRYSGANAVGATDTNRDTSPPYLLGGLSGVQANGSWVVGAIVNRRGPTETSLDDIGTFAGPYLNMARRAYGGYASNSATYALGDTGPVSSFSQRSAPESGGFSPRWLAVCLEIRPIAL